MLQQLSTERIPSCIHSGSESIAFALNPDQSCNPLCWSNCIVTRKLELFFTRPVHDKPSLKIPGAHRRAEAPQFFWFSCANTEKLSCVPIDSGRVLSCDVSQSSFYSETERSEVSSVVRGLPTVAVLFTTQDNETKLLVISPTLKLEKSERTIIYQVTLTTSPSGVRHVVMCPEGRALLLLEQCVAGDGLALQCFPLLVKFGQSQTVFRSAQLSIPSGLTSSVPNQRVIFARARRPLDQSPSSAGDATDMEVILLTDCAVVAVFRVSASNAERQGASCIWALHLLRQKGPPNKLLQSLSVVERWNTSISFRLAAGGCCSDSLPFSRDSGVSPQLQRFNGLSPVVCTSPNGAVILAALPNSTDACIAGLGANVHECANGSPVAHVLLPSALSICDASWISGSFCGFLLLGIDGSRRTVCFYFLPLTGEPPQRVQAEGAVNVLKDVGGGFVRFFSLSMERDVFGAPQTRISLLLGCEREKGDTKIMELNELDNYLFSPPTIMSLLSFAHSMYVWSLIYFTGMATFRSEVSRSLDVLAATSNSGTGGIFGDIQLRTEVALESQLDAWLLSQELSVEFTLSGLTFEVVQRLLASLQQCRFANLRIDKGEVAALLAVFQGAAGAIAALGISSSPMALKTNICEVHTVFVELRHALTVMGQYGAISACFSAVAPFARLDDNEGGAPACPEWRVLVGVLFDEAFAHTCAYPSLTHALLPHCSTSVKQMIGAGEFVEQRSQREMKTNCATSATNGRSECTVRSTQDVLSLARSGSSGLLELSPADVCWASRQLFFSEGIGAVQAFLKSFTSSHWVDHSDICTLFREYDTVREDIDIVLKCS